MRQDPPPTHTYKDPMLGSSAMLVPRYAMSPVYKRKNTCVGRDEESRLLVVVCSQLVCIYGCVCVEGWRAGPVPIVCVFHVFGLHVCVHVSVCTLGW